MRVGLIRQDLSRIYLDDVENTSQRNFSSQPPGQSRYFEFPSNTTLTSVLNQYAFLSNLGTGAVFPLTLTGANNTLTAIVVSGGPTVTMTIATGSYTAAALATAMNAAFAANGLAQALVASVVGGQIQVDTVAPGASVVPSFATYYNQAILQPPIGISPSPPSPFVSALNSGPTAYMHLGGTLATALGLGTSALSGLPVSNGAAGTSSLFGTSANAGVYQFTNITGQTGAAAAVTSVGTNGTATITGLTGMTANSTLHYLVLSGGSHASNDGTWQIVQYISATSVVIYNPAAVVDTSLTWHETTVSFNISYAQIGALSTFATMEGYSATTPTGSFLALATAIQNAVAPQLIETGPTLLSFAKGKLSILSASYFQPGYPPQSAYASPFGANEGATARLGYAQGAAVFITEDDGHTAYTI
jgi:hypothetical protein